MPAAKDLNPFDNPFGYAVRRHRLRLGLTQEQLGKRIGYSGDAVGKFEKGDVAPSIDLARACDEVFGTYGDMEQLHELVRNAAAFPSWMREWVEFERKAHTLRNWEPMVVPGLLQTAEYARELIKTYPGRTDEQVDNEVVARLERQKILDPDDPPMLWVVIHEHVLHCQVGSPEVMREQLQFLLEAAQRPRVAVRVVPVSAGMHPGNAGAFAIASFNGAPDVVYLESARAGRVVDRPEDVHGVMNIWEAIREETLPARASLNLIAKVKEQWT